MGFPTERKLLIALVQKFVTFACDWQLLYHFRQMEHSCIHFAQLTGFLVNR